MREPKLLAAREAPVIRARFRPASYATGADAACSLERLIDLETQERERLAEQRKRLAARLRARRKRSKVAAQSTHELRLKEVCQFYRTESEALLNEVLSKGREQLLQLSLKIAQSILQEEFAGSSGSLAAKLRRHLNQLPEAPRQIICSPSDYPALSSALDDLLPEGRLVHSPSQEYGQALIRTAGGSIEVSWQKEFDAIELRLREELLGAAPTASLSEYK